jgi:hypothetical protein
VPRCAQKNSRGSPMEVTEAAASLSQCLSKPNSSATSAARG